MAHFRRRRPRTSTYGGKHGRCYWLSHWPAWWDRVFHTRPQRRLGRKFERAILLDRIEADDASWPLGNSKPHRYYW